MDRRRFLQLATSVIVGGLIGYGCKGSSGPVNLASTGLQGGPWGQAPANYAHALLPKERRPEGMLKIFLLGGMTPWETFYTVPEHGDPAKGGAYSGQQWWSFQNEPNWMSIPEWYDTCEGGQKPLYEPFAIDSAGKTVNLGPLIHVLRDR
ncbi:MAG TPA: hypothetical protein EYN66_07290, partial [Myxococcales bacterium]|nr:hypothetical protein [Myxococcales bacterium]